MNYSHRNVFVRRKLGVCGLCGLSGSLHALLDGVFECDITAVQTCEQMFDKTCTSLHHSPFYCNVQGLCLWGESRFLCQQCNASPTIPNVMLLDVQIWREWKWNHDLYPVAIQYPSEIITKRAFVICSVLIWWHVLRGWIPLGPGTQFSSGSYRSSVSSILSENRRLIICTFVRLRAVI